jgi:hypothetical protein
MPGLIPPVGDERDGLLAFLAQQRHVIRVAAYGLTDDQARATPSPSPLSIGGLVKHVASVERNWSDTVVRRYSPSPDEYAASFHMAPDETLTGVLDLYAEVARETETIVADITDMGEAVPVPMDVPWFPQNVEAWSVRWVLLHLIEETARHAGHADIIRESLDGATAIPLMAAVEGWPATPWVEPWKPDRT